MRQDSLPSPSSRTGRFARRTMLCLALALPWTVLVAGCGQKGPLFHPPDPAGNEKKKDET